MAEVKGIFSGELVSPQVLPGVRRETAWLGRARSNSGAAALAQAVYWGASRVFLLGYDCQYTGGQRHWHGNHPAGLGNAAGIANWPDQFVGLLPRLKDAQVINITRQTALDMFQKMRLEEALA